MTTKEPNITPHLTKFITKYIAVRNSNDLTTSCGVIFSAPILDLVMSIIVMNPKNAVVTMIAILRYVVSAILYTTSGHNVAVPRNNIVIIINIVLDIFTSKFTLTTPFTI